MDITAQLNDIKNEKITIAKLEELWETPQVDKWFCILHFCRMKILKKYCDALKKRFFNDKEIKKIAIREKISLDELYINFDSFGNDNKFYDQIMIDCLNVEISFPSYFNDLKNINEEEIEKHVKFEFEIKESFINSLFDSFISKKGA